MNNEFLKYYGQHNISPVHQDINDFELHLRRRKKLYRQLGIPLRVFNNSKMLEIGPGGGYNTLCFFQWGIEKIDLVEANKAGVDNMKNLFAQYNNISQHKYKIFEKKIENFFNDKNYENNGYDVIIAEGFLQYVPNTPEIVGQIKAMAGKNGIVSVTCADEFGDFIETAKRMAAYYCIKGVKEYGEKVNILSGIFAPQLKSLKGVSRPIKDWVQDQLLSSVYSSEDIKIFTMRDMVELFAPEFEVLGCSPALFSDLSWYKDVGQNLDLKYIEQYKARRIYLLLAGMDVSCTPPPVKDKELDEIAACIHAIREFSIKYQMTFNDELFLNAHEKASVLCGLLKNIDEKLYAVLTQIRDIFLDIYKSRDLDLDFNLKNRGDKINWSKYPDFFSAFGRAQQYMSFVRR